MIALGISQLCSLAPPGSDNLAVFMHCKGTIPPFWDAFVLYLRASITGRMCPRKGAYHGLNLRPWFDTQESVLVKIVEGTRSMSTVLCIDIDPYGEPCSLRKGTIGLSRALRDQLFPSESRQLQCRKHRQAFINCAMPFQWHWVYLLFLFKKIANSHAVLIRDVQQYTYNSAVIPRFSPPIEINHDLVMTDMSSTNALLCTLILAHTYGQIVGIRNIFSATLQDTLFWICGFLFKFDTYTKTTLKTCRHRL